MTQQNASPVFILPKIKSLQNTALTQSESVLLFIGITDFVVTPD